MSTRQFSKDKAYVYCLDCNLGFTLKWAWGSWSVIDEDFNNIYGLGEVIKITPSQAYQLTGDPGGKKLDKFLEDVARSPKAFI